jgi:large subunit ribosomal protein L6
MSRIGKKPVPLLAKVKATVTDRTITIEGPLGTLAWEFPFGLTVTVDEAKKEIRVQRPDDQRRHRALHGLTRALIANMVLGVTQGYQRAMELYGTGYSANLQGKKLVLVCGFAHSVELKVPDGIQVVIEVAQTRGNDTPAKFTIKGCDKQLVGEFAAEIRHVRPAEPYLGKGFRYLGEQIRRKAGKTFVGGGAA